MKTIKYFFQFLLILFFFLIYKTLGAKISSNISYQIFKLLGPFFRPREIIEANINRAFPSLNRQYIGKIIDDMWGNYGRILSEYVYMKDFRLSDLSNNIEIKGLEILESIKKENEPVIFVSGHFNNFELMAMQIEKSGINLAAIYRPLNNYFLNGIMEKIRKKYICKNQIKKGPPEKLLFGGLVAGRSSLYIYRVYLRQASSHVKRGKDTHGTTGACDQVIRENPSSEKDRN